MKKTVKFLAALVFSLCLMSATLASAAAAGVSKVQNLKASATPTSVTLSWDKLDGVSGYQIQRYSKKWKTVKTVSASVKSYKATKLSAKKTYKFRVRAYIKNGKKKVYGPYTNISAKTVTAAVKSLTVKPSLTSASAQWSKVSGASGYEVKYSTSKKFPSKSTKTYTVKKSTAVKATLKSLSPAKTYYIRVRAYTTVKGKKHYGSYSPVVTVKTAVGALSSLSVKSTTVTGATVTWKAVSGATSYEVQKYVSGKWSKVTSATKNTTYTVSSLPSGTKVPVRVRARQTVKGKVYEGAWKTVNATTKIGGAKNLGYKNLTRSSVTLYWTGATGATSYQIQNNGVTVKTVTANSVSLSIAPGTKYSFRVISCKGSERGAASNTVTFISAPSAVSGLKTSGIADRSVTFTWNKSAGASGYEVDYGSGSAFTKAVTAGNSYYASGLNPGTTYKYRVRAYNKNGSVTQYSDWSAYMSVTTGGIFGITEKDDTASFKWKAISGAAKYFVQYYNPELSAWQNVKTVTTTSADVNSHINNRIGFYRVAAYDSGNKWLYTSDGVTVTVPGYDVTVDKHKVTVSWPFNSQPGVYKVVRYSQKNNESVEAFDTSVSSVSHYLAPGLVYTYEIYSNIAGTEELLACFGISAGDINISDTSDAGKHAQLLYAIEAINRTKLDDTHNTVINIDSAYTNVINNLRFGIKGFSGFGIIMGLAFGSKLKGTDYTINSDNISCNDAAAVDAFCKVLNEGETDKSKMLYQTEYTKNLSTITFKSGEFVGVDQDGNNRALYNVFGPSTDDYMARLYNDFSVSSWKNGISSVTATKTSSGYKIVIVIKQETVPDYHKGFISTSSMLENNNMQVVNSKIGSTTITLETDKECRLLSYESVAPYLADVTIADTVDTDTDGSFDIDLGMNIIRTHKQKVTFKRTK